MAAIRRREFISLLGGAAAVVAARGARAAYKGVVELVRCSSAMQTPTRSAQRWIAQVHSGREAADYSLPRSIGG